MQTEDASEDAPATVRRSRSDDMTTPTKIHWARGPRACPDPPHRRLAGQAVPAWTEATLLKQWFARCLNTTPHAELDVRPGGTNLVVMRRPDGNEFPNRGRLSRGGREPPPRLYRRLHRRVGAIEKPFMTVILTFEPEAGKTRYTARVRHWPSRPRGA